MASPSSFWAPINKKIEQRHTEEEKLKGEQRQAYLDLTQDPNASDEAKNWAWEQHQKLLNPGVRKKFSVLQPLVQKIFGMGGGQSQPMDEKPPAGLSSMPGAQTPIASSAGPKPAPTGPSTGPPAGPQIYNREGMADAAQGRKLKYEDQEVARRRAQADQMPEMNPRERNEFILLGKMPNAQLPEVKRNVQFKLPDGSIVNAQQGARSGTYSTLQGEPYVLPEGAEPYKAPTPGVKRQVRFKIDGKDVLLNQDSKTQELFLNGKHFDLPENAEPVDEQAYLVKLRTSGYGTGLFNTWRESLKSQHADWSDEQVDAAAGAVVEEVLKRQAENIGASRTSQPVTVNNGVIQPGRSGNVPRPLPMPVTPPPTAAPTDSRLPGFNPGAAPVPAPSAAPRPAPGANTPAAQAAPTGGGGIGMPIAQYNAQQQNIKALTAAATEIFGDPTQPDIKGLHEYSKLADNASSVKRLGEAFQIVGLLGDDIGSAHASAGAGGLGINIGSVGKAIENALGLPATVARQKAEILQKAFSQMTPEERQAYNATIAAKEAVIGGLRSTSRSSSAQFAVKAMQDLVPVIGVNVFDGDTFRDRMRRLSGVMVDGTRGIPNAAWDAQQAKIRDRILNLPKEAAASAGPARAPATPAAKPKKGDTKTYQGGKYEFDGTKWNLK